MKSRFRQVGALPGSEKIWKGRYCGDGELLFSVIATIGLDS